MLANAQRHSKPRCTAMKYLSLVSSPLVSVADRSRTRLKCRSVHRPQSLSLFSGFVISVNCRSILESSVKLSWDLDRRGSMGAIEPSLVHSAGHVRPVVETKFPLNDFILTDLVAVVVLMSLVTAVRACSSGSDELGINRTGKVAMAGNARGPR